MRRKLLTTLIVAALAAGGWFAWSKQRDAAANSTAASQPAEVKLPPPSARLSDLHQSLTAERDRLLAKHAEARFTAIAEYVARSPDAPDVSRALLELVDLGDELFRSADVVKDADLLLAQPLPPADKVRVQLLSAEALGRLGRVREAEERFAAVEQDQDPNHAVDATLRHAELLINAREPKRAKELYRQCSEKHADAALTKHLDRLRDDLDRIGDESPAFELQGVDGAPVTLEQYRGKVVLIEFWSTTCAHSLAEMPVLKRAYEKWHARGFEIVGVSLDTDAAKLDEFVRENGLTWRHVRLEDGWKAKVVDRFDVAATPTNVLIDRAGRIARVDLRGRSLGNALAFVLGE